VNYIVTYGFAHYFTLTFRIFRNSHVVYSSDY